MSRSTAPATATHAPAPEDRPARRGPLGLRVIPGSKLERLDLASLLALALGVNASEDDPVVALLEAIDRDADILEQAISTDQIGMQSQFSAAAMSISVRARVAAELHRRLLEEKHSENTAESAADQSGEVRR